MENLIKLICRPKLACLMLLFIVTLFLDAINIANCHQMPDDPTNVYLYPYTKNRIVVYHFNITDGIVQPDNFQQMGYLINGKFPGPLIICDQYDLVKVTVTNNMVRDVTIHWHGLLQAHTLASDGVPGVTQRPIAPGETFDYQIQTDSQTGTYAYHGHFHFDIAFIHGAFIIRDNPAYWKELGRDYQYDLGHEHYFMLEQIYHYSMDQFYLDITGQAGNSTRRPSTASLPINGLSYGQWPNNNGDAAGYEVVSCVPRKRYRFRIINMTPDAFLRFEIENHKMVVIEADGIVCHPVEVDYVEINTGQRYSVLVFMNQPPKNYWIRSMNIGTRGGPDNGRAILHYDGAPDPDPLRKIVFNGTTPGLNFSEWILPELYPNKHYYDSEVYNLPKYSDKEIIIDTHMVASGPNGTFQVLINGHFNQLPTNGSYLEQVQNGVDIGVTDSPQVHSIYQNQVVDVIFQNRVIDLAGVCLEHPWHLHGHTFWVLAQGPDLYDMSTVRSVAAKNAQNEYHQFRDVFTTFPNQTKTNTTSGAPCGWYLIRFIANNPGIWLAHCHITDHMLIGKQFVFYEYNKYNPELYNE